MGTTDSPEALLALAVERVGGQSAFARVVGVTQGAVWQRLNGGKPVAPGWVLKTEEATGISRHDLRPDLYPREPVPSTLSPRGVQHVDRPDPATRHNFGAGLEQAR